MNINTDRSESEARSSRKLFRMLNAIQRFISRGASFRGEYAHPAPFHDFKKNDEGSLPKAPTLPSPPLPQPRPIRSVKVVQKDRSLGVDLTVDADASWFAGFYDKTNGGYKWVGGVVSDEKERTVKFDAFDKGSYEVFVYPLESECPLPNPSECMNVCFVQGDCEHFRPGAWKTGKSSTFILR